jgi:hypothetical protein
MVKPKRTKPKRWREPDPADLPYHLQPGLTPEEIAALPKWKRKVRARYERNKAEHAIPLP